MPTDTVTLYICPECSVPYIEPGRCGFDGHPDLVAAEYAPAAPSFDELVEALARSRMKGQPTRLNPSNVGLATARRDLETARLPELLQDLEEVNAQLADAMLNAASLMTERDQQAEQYVNDTERLLARAETAEAELEQARDLLRRWATIDFGSNPYHPFAAIVTDTDRFLKGQGE